MPTRENGKDIFEDFPDDVDRHPRGGHGDDFPSDMENDWARVPGQLDVEDHESVSRTRPGDERSIPRDCKTIIHDSPLIEWIRQPNEDIPRVPDEDIPFRKPRHLNSVPHMRNPDEASEGWARFPSQEIPELAINDDDDDAPFDKQGDGRSIPRVAIPPQENSPETDWE
jgi:hypothetical protein